MARGQATRIWALALIGQAVIAVLLIWTVSSSTAHDARLVIVAPPIVSTALVEQAAGMPGHPFEARATGSAKAAVAAVRDGRADAAVIVDLTADEDTLQVSAALGSRGRAAVARAVDTVSSTLGRTVHVETVPMRGDRRTPYVVVLAALVLGFAAAVAVTWIRGPHETTFPAGAGRFIGFAALGVVAAIALWGEPLGLRLVAGALVLAAALTTTALEAVFGVAGLAVSALIFILTAAPMGRFTPALLVPQPWHGIIAWLPYGAGLAIANDAVLFGHVGSARAWGVLAAWVAVSTLTLTVARLRRPPQLSI